MKPYSTSIDVIQTNQARRDGLNANHSLHRLPKPDPTPRKHLRKHPTSEEAYDYAALYTVSGELPSHPCNTSDLSNTRLFYSIFSPRNLFAIRGRIAV